MFEKLKRFLAPELELAEKHNAELAETKRLEEVKRLAEEEAKQKVVQAREEAKAKRLEEEAKAKISPKEKATAAGEPYIAILSVDIDQDDINNGAFELDWNDKFILNLIRNGYRQKETDSDSDIVDRWFTQVCRNIALEVYEQEVADPDKRMSEILNDIRVMNRKDLGDGYSEIS